VILIPAAIGRRGRCGQPVAATGPSVVAAGARRHARSVAPGRAVARQDKDKDDCQRPTRSIVRERV